MHALSLVGLAELYTCLKGQDSGNASSQSGCGHWVLDIHMLRVNWVCFVAEVLLAEWEVQRLRPR